MKTLACYSIKGGVGKTAAAVNLAHIASRSGIRTLICDLDSQGASSFYFRVRTAKGTKPRQLLSKRGHLLRTLRGSDYPGLDVLPANVAYRKFDLVMDTMKRPRRLIAKVLERVSREYDLVVLDCPPGLSLLAENVFHAADVVTVPVIPTTLSERSLEQLYAFFGRKGCDERKLRPFFSMVEYRKRLHAETMLRLRAEYRCFLDAEIPYNADVERMGVHREPIAAYAPRGRAALAYGVMWKELRAALFGDRASDKL